MAANDSPNAGLLTEETLAKSAECVAQMEATLQRVAQEMARSNKLVRKLIDRFERMKHPPPSGG